MVTESRGKPTVKEAEVVAVDPGGNDSDQDPVPVAPAIAAAPVPMAPAIAVAPLEVGAGSSSSTSCKCQSEVHRLTDEMYKLGGVNKDLINENQLLKNKVHFLAQDAAIAVAPLEVGAGSSSSTSCKRQSEVHRLTDEMYKLGGVNKDLINENQLLKNKVHFLEQDVKSLQIKLKNKETSLKLMNINGYRLMD